mmetsp:Transcript_7721/g.10750  ORF Transcript_7721/g.10750 Transcript_7721/m.10750 type:complete len:92 (-) Transcript_7721:861-1136(-)
MAKPSTGISIGRPSSTSGTSIRLTNLEKWIPSHDIAIPMYPYSKVVLPVLRCAETGNKPIRVLLFTGFKLIAPKYILPKYFFACRMFACSS